MSYRDYENYLLSEHWSQLRSAALNAANRRCEACRSMDRLRGHHLVYRTPLTDCTREDIMCLCEKCHDLWHAYLRKSGGKLELHSRESTRGAIQALRFAEWRESKPAKTELTPQPVKIPPPEGRKPNKAALLRGRMRNDAEFMAFLLGVKDRKTFKRELGRFVYAGVSHSSFASNAFIVWDADRGQKPPHKPPVVLPSVSQETVAEYAAIWNKSTTATNFDPTEHLSARGAIEPF